MSIPQAMPSVQRLSGLSAGGNNGSLPFAPPVSRPLAPGSPVAWSPGVPLDVWGPIWDTSRPVIAGSRGAAPVVQVNGIWLFQETVQTLEQAPWSQSPLDIARAGVRQGLGRMRELPQGMLTQHALMVAWGEFAHEIGLIPKLQQVPMSQKSVVHTPQAKVLTFLMGILTGITHLKDLNEGPHPLAHDWPTIRAWGLASLAHYSGVSRTLASCDEATVEAITQVLHEVSQPFIEQEVQLLLKRNLPLILDLDLAPRRVSNTSTTFPDAQFGWQDDRIGLGYDAALVALTSSTYGRLFLSGFHYPRNPVSLPRLQRMVYAAEERLGRRPRRRTELVKQRLKTLETPLAQRRQWLLAQVNQQRQFRDQLDTLPAEAARLEAEVAALEASYQAQDREEKPYSQLAKARRRLTAVQKKLAKAPQRLKQAEQATATHRKRLDQLAAKRTELKVHLARLEADNEDNAHPVPIIVRVDAGFGTGPNIAWLIEMGFLVYTKAYNAQVAAKLRAKVEPDTQWTRVGSNAEMIAWDEQYINHCPYPLTLALERFHTPNGLKYSTLIAYRDDGQHLTLPAWFDFYNARQTIEAGIKEVNVVFKMHPLKMRSRSGIALQEQFSLFAANFVRWAMAWLRERVVRSSSRFDEALTRVKTMVRVAANTSAWVVGQDADLLVMFDETGAYPGVELHLTETWRTRPPMLPRKKVQKLEFRNGFASGCT